MKSTIYVPDELWDRARALGSQGSNPSQLVQSALTEWVHLRAPRRFDAFEVPTNDDVTIDEALFQMERLRREAQSKYADGYAAGVRAAANMSWSSLESFGEIGFDLTEWTDSIRNGID